MQNQTGPRYTLSASESSSNHPKIVFAKGLSLIQDSDALTQFEKSGLDAYHELALLAPDPAISELLEANGREELAHAHRVAKVIHILYGEEFSVPVASENPYLGAFGAIFDKQTLAMRVLAERNGVDLYEGWAERIGDSRAAALLRQNAQEERGHAERAANAIIILERHQLP